MQNHACVAQLVQELKNKEDEIHTLRYKFKIERDWNTDKINKMRRRQCMSHKAAKAEITDLRALVKYQKGTIKEQDNIIKNLEELCTKLEKTRPKRKFPPTQPIKIPKKEKISIDTSSITSTPSTLEDILVDEDWNIEEKDILDVLTDSGDFDLNWLDTLF